MQRRYRHTEIIATIGPATESEQRLRALITAGVDVLRLAALRATRVPIFAFTDDEALFRQLLLPWGVEPFLMPFSDDPEVTLRDALSYLRRRSWCHEGDWLVVITDALAHDAIIDTLPLRRVG